MAESSWEDRLLMLPDEQYRLPSEDGVGVVACGEDCAKAGGFLQSVADAMRPVYTDAPHVLSVRYQLQHRLQSGDTAAWRGLLATALLIDTYDADVSLVVLPVTPGITSFSNLILQAAELEKLFLVTLQKGGQNRILGIADPEYGIIPAAWMDDLSDMLPKAVTWYDRTTQTFSDPVKCLNQRDRLQLTTRLQAFGPMCLAFAEDIRQRSQELAVIDKTSWRLRMEAAVSLAKEPAFSHFVSIKETRYRTQASPLLAALQLREEACLQLRRQDTCFWKDIPIGQSSNPIGWESTGDPREDLAFTDITNEITLLHRESVRYQGDLALRLEQWQRLHTTGLTEKAQASLTGWMEETQLAAGKPQEPLTLTGPWQPSSALDVVL